jgi:hypothetical protein
MRGIKANFLSREDSRSARNDDTRVLTTAHGSPVTVAVGNDVTEPSTLTEVVGLGVAVETS